MGKAFGYERGLVKYIIKTPLTVVGFISMYLFGGGILSFLTGLTHLFGEGNVLEAVLFYFVSEYLPPTSIGEVLVQTFIGSLVAGILWYMNTPR